MPDFLVIPQQVFSDKTLSAVDMMVYGIIYFYSRMKDERCFASNRAFANILGVRPNKISESLSRLQERDVIRVVYSDKEKRTREEIIPLIVMGRTTIPFGFEGGGHLRTGKGGYPDRRKGVTPNGVQNNNNYKEEENNISIAEESATKTLPPRAYLPKEEIDRFIRLFRAFNPAWQKLLVRKAERDAAARLLGMESYEWWVGWISRYTVIIRTDSYCPKATAPWKLEEKFGEIAAHLSSKKMGELTGGGKGRGFA